MRVLITGGAGYIGSHTAKALARAGIEPVSGMVCVGIAQPDRTSILLDAGANYVISDFRSLSYSVSVLQKMFV